MDIDEILMKKSKEHAPDMDDRYHQESVKLMKHMLELEKRKKKGQSSPTLTC